MNLGSIALGLALLGATVGQLLLDYRTAVPIALALCIAAVVLAAIARPQADEEAPRPPWTVVEVGGVALLVALALVARLVANGDYPLGVSYDESANALEA